MTPHDPLSALLEDQGLVILDGGLATELEARGAVPQGFADAV